MPHQQNERLPLGEFIEPINGVDLHFRVAGSGPTCILQTPGWGPEIAMYRDLSGFEEIFTMVYLDTRGTGRSSRPDDATFTFANLAADVEGVRELFGVNKVVAMGHSFAGALCIEYALRHPSSVAGLVLLDAVVAEVPEAQADREQRIAGMEGEPWFTGAIETLGRLLGGYAPSSDEEFGSLVGRILPPYFVDQSIRERFERGLHDAIWSHDAYRASFNLELHDLRPRLSEIDAPTAIAVGREDFICGPIQSHWLDEGLRNSILIEIDGVGHFPWLEAPESLVAPTDVV